MTGVAATFSRRAPGPVSGTVDQLMSSLAWRGQDQAATWHDGPVSMGVCQFWSTPEDQGSTQPARSTATGCALAFDGRVDNRADLLRDLGAGHVGRDSSDAELVLAAYERWGDAFAQRLAGPFSLVVWDAARRRLVCARDALGLRPLFYRLTPDAMVVASTIGALRQLPGGGATLNDDYLWDFLGTAGLSGSLDAEETPFVEIRRVLPGHLLTVTGETTHVERFWRPWELEPLRYGTDEEYAEHFRHLFEEVVLAHHRAVGPVCATLSGGLDSSAIVCVGRELERSGALTGAPFSSLSLVWPEETGTKEGFDERRYIDEVVARHPGPAHYLPADELHRFDFFGEHAASYEEPFTMFGQHLWTVLADETVARGSRVLIAGSGGDHLLTGNRFYLADLLRRGALRELVRSMQAESRRLELSYPVLASGYLAAPFLSRHAAGGLLARLAKDADRRRIDPVYRWEVPGWIREPDAQRVRGRRRHALLGRRFASRAAQCDFEQLEFGSQDHVRLPLAGATLARGVDLRNPFFDVRLATFCLRLPADLKCRDGVHKLVLRLALRDTLPPDLYRRGGKTAYNFALTRHVRRAWPVIQDMYADAESERLGFVDTSAFMKAMTQLQQGGSGTVDLPSLITALGLEDWLRRNGIDGGRAVAYSSAASP